MFQQHPSKVLNEHFRRKPFQGAHPHAARFVFVGLDANYAKDVETSPIFPSLMEYHEDGPAFWKRTGLHHPFLLPQYKGDGQRYHRTFAKVGFQPEHADLVSFVELLDRPTIGRNSLNVVDLDRQHLSFIREAILGNKPRYTFVSAGVLRLMTATGAFPELSTVRRTFSGLRILHEDDANVVFLHLHFSNYGRFEQQLQSEARGIAGLLPIR